MAYLAQIPQWVWLAVACVLVEIGILVFALNEHARANRWEQTARAAQNTARLWRSVADVRGAHNKRTVVAPQYHAPRVG
jgi:hypothetical protein